MIVPNLLMHLLTISHLKRVFYRTVAKNCRLDGYREGNSLSKYSVGNSFKIITNKKNVDLKILFVPPIDYMGVQSYLCEKCENGNIYYVLLEETEIDKYYFKI